MAFPNPSFSDIIATTIQNRSSAFADALTRNNPLLDYFRTKKVASSFFDGGYEIMENVMFDAPGSVGFYSGYQTLALERNESQTAAAYPLIQAYASVQMSNREMLQNAGRAQIIDLAGARIDAAGAGLANAIGASIHSDGTGSGGQEIGGLQLLVSDAPTSGSPGGIDRALNSFWRNQVFSGVTDGTLGGVSAANIDKYMARLYGRCTRGKDVPTMGIADNNYFFFYHDALTAIKRLTSSDAGDSAFKTVEFNGIPIYLGGGYGGSMPTDHLYLLNTNYLKLKTHRRANFVPSDKRMAVNQDSDVKLILWAGNLTMSNAFVHGVLIA